VERCREEAGMRPPGRRGGYTPHCQTLTRKPLCKLGSIDAMQNGSADRYFQKGAKKLVPEGVVARFVKISPATVQENHPHDVTIAKKASNY